MIDYINKAMYIVTGDYTTARTLSICIITIVTLLLFALVLRICRVRQKAVFVSIGAILTAFAVSSCFFLAPLHVVRYNGTYSDYEGVTDVADTHFVAKFKGITASVPRAENCKYLAYVGSSNTTVVVVELPENVKAYRSDTGTFILVCTDSETAVPVTVYKVTGRTTTTVSVNATNNGTTVTALSTRYGVIKTEVDVYDNTFTKLLYPEGSETYYAPD